MIKRCPICGCSMFITTITTKETVLVNEQGKIKQILNNTEIEQVKEKLKTDKFIMKICRGCGRIIDDKDLIQSDEEYVGHIKNGKDDTYFKTDLEMINYVKQLKIDENFDWFGYYITNKENYFLKSEIIKIREQNNFLDDEEMYKKTYDNFGLMNLYNNNIIYQKIKDYEKKEIL